MEFNNKYTFFIDISGSVANFDDYWYHVEKIYRKYLEKKQAGRIFIWDNNIKEISKKKFETLIESKFGGSGTEPAYIAKTLLENKIKSHIIIFTDGEVSDSSVANVDRILKNTELNNVQCYIIAHSNANLSVTCPFTRNNNSIVHWKTIRDLDFATQVYKKPNPVLINKLETMETLDLNTFNAMYEQLESIIISRNMGKSGEPEIKEKLIKLKKHLIIELVEKFSKISETHRLSNTKLEPEIFIPYIDISIQIEKSIEYLISLCGDLRGQYSIDAIRSNKIKISEHPKVDKSTQVDMNLI